MVSSGMLRHVALVRSDVSEELSASFIRVTRIGELGTTLAVTSNRRTLRRKVSWHKRVCFCPEGLVVLDMTRSVSDMYTENAHLNMLQLTIGTVLRFTTDSQGNRRMGLMLLSDAFTESNRMKLASGSA
jgi:hypothetical protein